MFAWLMLLVMGVEKAALTALPRTRALTRQYTRMLLGRAATPLAVTGAAAVLLMPVGGTPALLAAAAAWMAGQGLLTVLAATHRLNGHPGRDGAAFLAMAGWVLGATALAATGLLDPYGYLVTLLAGIVADCAVLALLIPALRVPPARVRTGRRHRSLINRRIVLLGPVRRRRRRRRCRCSTVLISAMGRPADSATLYVVIVVSSALGGLGILLLRLRQPVTSLELRGPGGEIGRRLAARVAGWAAAITAGTVTLALAAVLAAYAGSGATAVAAIGSSRLVLAAVVAVEMTVFCALLYAVNLLENTNGAVLLLTSAAAVAGLAGTVFVALIAVPVLHAVGAMLALVAGLAAKAGPVAPADPVGYQAGARTASCLTSSAPMEPFSAAFSLAQHDSPLALGDRPVDEPADVVEVEVLHATGLPREHRPVPPHRPLGMVEHAAETQQPPGFAIGVGQGQHVRLAQQLGQVAGQLRRG
jgi:hypothetical protein